MNDTAYNNWIHEQLEPEDRLPHHKHSAQYNRYRVALDPETIKQLDRLNTLASLKEWEEREDAYLRSKGIL
jgi:hypothetical protein